MSSRLLSIYRLRKSNPSDFYISAVQLRFQAAGLKGIDRYTTFGHICNLVGSDGATAERLLF